MLNGDVKISFGGCSTVSEELTSIISKIGEFNVFIYNKILLFEKDTNLQNFNQQLCYVYEKTNMILIKIMMLFFNYLKNYNELFNVLINLEKKNMSNYNHIQNIVGLIENIPIKELNKGDIDHFKTILNGGCDDKFYFEESDKIKNEIKIMNELFSEGKQLKSTNISIRTYDNLEKMAILNFNIAVKTFTTMFNNQNKILNLLILKIKNIISNSTFYNKKQDIKQDKQKSDTKQNTGSDISSNTLMNMTEPKQYITSMDITTNRNEIKNDVGLDMLNGGKFQSNGTIIYNGNVKTILSNLDEF